jgi:hypothetical protein
LIGPSQYAHFWLDILAIDSLCLPHKAGNFPRTRTWLAKAANPPLRSGELIGSRSKTAACFMNSA